MTMEKSKVRGGMMQILNIILILALAIVPAVLLAMKVSGVWLYVFANIIALFFANLDKFEGFTFISKLFSLEAQLRKTLDKAYAALEDLKELALAVTEPMIVDLTMSGQMLKRIKLEYKLESVEKIADLLRRLGASDKEIEQACGYLYEKVRIILTRNILASIRPENWESSDIYKGFSSWDFLDWDKAKIEKFATVNSLVITDDVNEQMADLEYFMQTKKLRRPTEWNDGWQF